MISFKFVFGGLLTAGSMLLVSTSVLAQTQTSAPQGSAPAAAPTKPACVCQATNLPNAQPQKKKKHKVLKALAHEFSTEMGDLGKDMALAFSVQGFDPYDMPENPNIPYVAAEAQFIDGSSSHIIKYPDQSLRVQGGFLDGTYACPQGEGGLYIVQYPNGAQGKLEMTPGVGAVIYRPDNTYTKITKTGSGGYRVENNKIGYMGDITPDTTGLSYEFAKQGF